MTELRLRELRGKDVFTVLNIVKKMDILNEIKDIINTSIKDEALSSALELSEKELQKEIANAELGAVITEKALEFVINKVPKAEHEINAFLGELTETDEQTIADLSLKEYVQLLKDFFGHPDLKELLGSVSQLLQSK